MALQGQFDPFGRERDDVGLTLDIELALECLVETSGHRGFSLESPLGLAGCLGLRTDRTLPLEPPPQKNCSAPSDSRPETPTPDGISTLSSTVPDRGSMRRSSLSSPSQVPCQSSPFTQVTPVTKRFDSRVRRIAPVSGSI